MRLSPLMLFLALACDKKPDAPPPPPTSTATPPPFTPSPDPTVRRVSATTCEKVADNLNRIVVDALSVEHMTPTDKRSLAALAAARRDTLVRFCVETSVPAEAECMLEAEDASELIACERHRRQVPAGLLEGNPVTRDDCELFYFRLRQFRILDGVDPGTIDRDREQIVRKCEDEARPGTLVCFIAAPDYETARRCP